MVYNLCILFKTVKKKAISESGINLEEICNFLLADAAGQMERLKELRKARGMDEDWAKMMEKRPMFGDRMARSADDIRSRLDEARRVNVEEMRQLQK